MEFSGRLLQDCFPYAALLGSTVDTCLASVFEAFRMNFTRFLRDGIPVVAQMQIPLVRLP